MVKLDQKKTYDSYLDIHEPIDTAADDDAHYDYKVDDEKTINDNELSNGVNNNVDCCKKSILCPLSYTIK